MAKAPRLVHHGEDADWDLAGFPVLRRGDDDERPGSWQGGKGRCSGYNVISVERELAPEVAVKCPVRGQVERRLQGEADGVAGVDEELCRIRSDGEMRG